MESLWDKLDLGLADKIISATSFNDEQIRLIAEGLQPQERILDLCIGFGNLAKVLVEQGKTVYGLDIRPESLEYAKRKIGETKHRSLYLVQGDAQKLKYKSEFDGVSCVSNFGFPDLDPVTSGIYNALNPRGYFAVTGIESSKLQKHMEAMQSEVTRKIQECALNLTEEEIEQLKEVGAFYDFDQVKDSSQRVIDSLTRNGFKVNRVELFHQESCYFILAQRD
jgi:ubiquinone/menaquinone biosynthesis C-methylase UbiE